MTLVTYFLWWRRHIYLQFIWTTVVSFLRKKWLWVWLKTFFLTQVFILYTTLLFGPSPYNGEGGPQREWESRHCVWGERLSHDSSETIMLNLPKNIGYGIIKLFFNIDMIYVFCIHAHNESRDVKCEYIFRKKFNQYRRWTIFTILHKRTEKFFIILIRKAIIIWYDHNERNL